MRPVAPEAARVRSNRLIRELRNMGLDPDHFVIFGSAPLLAHGLRTRVSDLDVVARGAVWERVSADGTPALATRSSDRVWQFCQGRLQFSEHWITQDWDTDALIDNAEIIAGLRFAPLMEVLRYKEELKRPKDAADIEALRHHLGLPADALATTAVASAR